MRRHIHDVGLRVMLAVLLCAGFAAAGVSRAVPASAAITFDGPSAVGRNSDGRLEVFASDGATVYHKWQSVTGNGWSNWVSLGDPPGDFPVQLRVGSNADGRLEVFTVAYDGTIGHRWQAVGGDWSSWASLGCCGSQAAVASNSDGRLEIFIEGTDQVVYHKWQTAANGSYSSWNSLGGVDETGGDLEAVRAVDGRVQIFVSKGNLGTVVTRRQVSGGWGDWAGLGGPATGAYSMSVGTNSDGRLEIFTLGYDGVTYHKYQDAGGAWSGWASLGGGGDTATAVGRNSDGRLEVFNQDGYTVWHIYQSPNYSGGWSGWSSLGSAGGGIQGGAVQVGMNTGGWLELFVVGANGSMYHDYQASTSSGWSGWLVL